MGINEWKTLYKDLEYNENGDMRHCPVTVVRGNYVLYSTAEKPIPYAKHRDGKIIVDLDKVSKLINK